MSWRVFTALLALLGAHARSKMSTSQDMCCKGDCPTKKEQKYFSISDDQLSCGEACFPFAEMGLYLQIDPNLETAGTIYPCAAHGYETYVETVTLEGEIGLQLTEDLYQR